MCVPRGRRLNHVRHLVWKTSPGVVRLLMAVALAVVNSTTSGTIVSFIISLVVKADKVLDA